MAPQKRRSQGDGAFFQRSDGTWIGRVELPPKDGKRRYKTVTSVDRNTAMAKLKKLRAEVDQGLVAVTSSTTVEKWLTHWIDEIHAKRKIRPGVIDDYRAVIRNHIVPAIGSKRVDKLTPQHVRDMHTAIGARRTAVVAHVVLSKALKDALREGIVTRNVVVLVDPPTYTMKTRPSLTVDVAKHVLKNAISSCDESTATRIVAGFMTGARRGELLGLRWSYVNLDTGLLDFSWQLQSLTQAHGCEEPCGRRLAAYCPQRKWDLPPGFEYEECEASLLFTRPKTKSGKRVVPAVGPLWAALTQLHEVQGPNPHDLVWHVEGKPISPRDDYEVWRGVFRGAGIIGPTESLPPHVARHTTATLLRAAGVDEQTRMEILGHATVDSQRIYAHADLDRHRSAMGNLGELLS